MTTILPPDSIPMPPPDLPDNVPDDPLSPNPDTPAPSLPDLYPTDPPPAPYPETPRLPGDPALLS